VTLVQDVKLPLGILVVEGDAGTLRQQGLLGGIDSVETMLRSTVNAGALRFLRYAVESSEDVDMGRALAEVFPHDGVIVVAHGNPQAAMVAPNHLMPWGDVARSLAPTKPRVALVVSCYGGMSTGAHEFFANIPSLQLFIGSPVDVAMSQTVGGFIEFFAELRGARLDSGWSAIVVGVNAWITGGMVFRRSRDEWNGGLSGAWVAQDLMALAARFFQ
jgi:hypothetical protein